MWGDWLAGGRLKEAARAGGATGATRLGGLSGRSAVDRVGRSEEALGELEALLGFSGLSQDKPYALASYE